MPEQRNKKILDQVKAVTHKDMLSILHEIDQDFLKETVSGERFEEYFFANCQDKAVGDMIRGILA